MSQRIFLLLPVLAVAIASARDKPDDWLEVRSPHFTVVSNTNEKQARNVADQFERMRSVFHAAFPRMQVDSGSPIIVLATKDEKDFRALEPEAYLGKGKLKLGGLFLRAPDKNYVLLRLDAGGQHPYAVVYHEYTHLLSSRAQEWLPLWLNEGLAEFYQNTEIRDKEALLGQPSEENILLLRQNRLLPLTTLFAVDHSSPYYHEENKGSIFYAESWALTHYLTTKDWQEKTHRLADYIELLSQKVDAVTAATRAFGDLKQLQAALEKYVGQFTFNYFKMPNSTEVDHSGFKVQALTASQAAAVRADFLAYNQRVTDARALLEQVLRADPNSVPAQETMGYVEFRQGHLDEARKWYEQAVKLDSHNYLAYYYFAAISMGGGQLNSEDEARVESSLRTAIKLNPSFAPAYDRLAVFYGMRRQNLQEAYMLALSAVTLDPGSVDYRLNAANILLASQRGADAIRVLRNALKLAKSQEETASVQGRLEAAEQYQTAQERAGQLSRRAVETTASEKRSEAEGAVATAEEASSAPHGLQRAGGFPPRGPHRTVSGTLKDVQCSAPAMMELKVEAGERTIALHADNYFKIQFTAANYTPTGELQPCSELEGMHARVEFVESSGKTSAGQIVSVELHK